MKRITSLDLARGFTVLMIAPIHTVMLFSHITIRTTLLAELLAFIAEWHGAQIFMLIMGFSFTCSQNQTVKSSLIKSIRLMTIAYALNIFKFVIPHFFGWLSPSLLTELQIDPGIQGYIQLLATGDILHFAAIATLLLPWFSKLNIKLQLLIIVSFIVLSPVFWDIPGLGLIGGQPPRIFFPLLPWIVYPFIGVMMGNTTKNSHWIGFDSFWIPGLGLLILGASSKYWFGPAALDLFYRTRPVDTILHVGFVMIALSIWDWLSKNVRANYAFRLFSYCSRNITRIYVIQWLLIFILLPFIGYQQSGFAASILLILLTTMTTLIASLFTDLIKSSK